MFTPPIQTRLVVLACCLLASACTDSAAPANEGTGPDPTEAPSVLDGLSGSISYEIVAIYPHDPDAFTQGLEVVGSTFIESTGLYGESDRRIVDIDSGKVLDLARLADEFFAEGLTVVDDEIYQLTWQSGSVFVSDLATLEQTRELTLDRQGWGLCYDGTHLVSSDGSSRLNLRETESLATQSTITVTHNGIELAALNELECLDDYVLANVYQTASIVLIEKATGTVTASLDLAALVPDVVVDPSNDVLNGIAYRAETDTFFVTGKRWDTIYEISLSPT